MGANRRRVAVGISRGLSSHPLFLALEQGPTFTAAAALGTLSAVLANMAFGISYAWSATRFSWPLCLVAGFVGYFSIVACLNLWAPSLYWAVPGGVGRAVGRTAPLSFISALGTGRTQTSQRCLLAMGAGVMLVYS